MDDQQHDSVFLNWRGYVVGHSLDYPRMQKSPEEVLQDWWKLWRNDASTKSQ